MTRAAQTFSLHEFAPILQEILQSGGEFVLTPRGHSMMPLLRSGRDRVVLISPTALEKGDIVLFRRPAGEYVLHRIVEKNDASFTVCGDAQCAPEDVLPEQIIACVKTVYLGKKALCRNTLSYRCYLFFVFRPCVRRFHAFLYNRTPHDIDQ